MRTLFDAVQQKLVPLIPRFGVARHEDTILKTYRQICGDSLNLPVGAQRPELSRINRDGTAVQRSLALGRNGGGALQFLGDPGAGGLVSGRLVADSLGLTSEFSAITNLLETGPDSRDCQTGHWIGVSFPPAGAAAMTIYRNGSCGTEDQQWASGAAFAEYFSSSEAWSRMALQLRGQMRLLGMGVTLTQNRPASGRLYFSAYGLLFSNYQQWLPAIAEDHTLGPLLDDYCDVMFGQEQQYPCRSAVCSFEFAAGGRLNTKFEVCAHCAWDSEAEASARCLRWLAESGIDPSLYLESL